MDQITGHKISKKNKALPPTPDDQSKLPRLRDERNIGSGTPRLVDW